MEISTRYILVSLIAVLCSACSEPQNQPVSQESRDILRVAVSPYQDIAMLVAHEELGLSETYDLDLDLITMAWEDILPTVASRRDDVDVGFGSYLEHLSKQHNLWKNPGEEVIFIAPAYIYKGGGLVTFNDEVEPLDIESSFSNEKISTFLTHTFGVQNASIYETMLFVLAQRADIDRSGVKVIESDMDSALLAAINGSVDVAGAGLTQINETKRRGGRVVLTMDDMGFADITGFIAKRSTYMERKSEIDRLVRMWFESADYVLSDLDANTDHVLEYLANNAATTYSLETYKQAVAQEYFPRSLAEARQTILAEDGNYSYKRIGREFSSLLVEQERIPKLPTIPKMNL